MQWNVLKMDGKIDTKPETKDKEGQKKPAYKRA